MPAKPKAAPAKKVAPAKAPRTRKAPTAKAAAALVTGAMDFTDPNGKVWMPVFCHDHQDSGYTPGCESCDYQVQTTLEHARRNATV